MGDFPFIAEAVNLLRFNDSIGILEFDPSMPTAIYGG